MRREYEEYIYNIQFTTQDIIKADVSTVGIRKMTANLLRNTTFKNGLLLASQGNQSLLDQSEHLLLIHINDLIYMINHELND